MTYDPPTNSDRHIRVFVSSTFRDMQAERDILVKTVFPQLRKCCEARGVTWTEVDLRWGITDEQAAEGHVLPLCLAEIAGCRPYFIGLLGERYGWVPRTSSPALDGEQGWLTSHREESVTELEILHGVLNDPSMATHSFFYFRDPAYVTSVEPSQRHDFLSEDPAAAAKLVRLKGRIRAAVAQGALSTPPRENYRDPQALGALVLRDFQELIDQLYPANSVPDPVEQERSAHDAYGRNRALAFVPRLRYTQQLDEYALDDDAAPLVVLGESGVGKSALLAHWVMDYRRAHPGDVVVEHFVGSTADSADWVRLLQRIMAEIKRAFDLPDQVPTEASAVRAAFPDWLTQLAGRGRTVLVLDALNQLEDKDGAQDLGWLPITWPPNVRVVISALDGPALRAIERRGWLVPTRTLTISPFDVTEREAAIVAFLGLFRKQLSAGRTRRLTAAPQCGNPLFLRALLDELRQFGEHDRLDERISHYLSAPDPAALYERILDRWVDDFSFGRQLVFNSLCLIAASRRGLSEAEILDLLGDDSPLPRAFWTPFYLAGEGAMVNRSGLLNFGHAYLQAAVWRRWLNGPDLIVAFRRRLIGLFEKNADPTPRRLEELPWLLCELNDIERLRDCLTWIPTFSALFTERYKWDLHHYWNLVAKTNSPVDCYRAALERFASIEGVSRRVVSHIANELGAFHMQRADFAAAEQLFRRAVETDASEADQVIIADHLHNLASVLLSTNRREEAEPVLRRALAMHEQQLGPDHSSVARDLYTLNVLLSQADRYAEAEPLVRRALEIDEAHQGPDHPLVAMDLSSLAMDLHATGRSEEAEQKMRRALAIVERHQGPNHPDVVRHLLTLSVLLHDRARLSEAETLLTRGLAISERAYGVDHPEVARGLGNLATVVQFLNRLGDAESMLRRALRIEEQSFGPDHPRVAKTLNNLAHVLLLAKRFTDAEPLMRRALHIDEASYGEDGSEVARDLINLAGALTETGRWDEAEPLNRRAVTVMTNTLGPSHPNVGSALNNLSHVLQGLKRLPEAEPVARRALEIFESNLGPDHPNVAYALNNLAHLLREMGRLTEAEAPSRRAVEIFLKFSQATGETHLHLQKAIDNHTQLLTRLGHGPRAIQKRLNSICAPYGLRSARPRRRWFRGIIHFLNRLTRGKSGP